MNITLEKIDEIRRRTNCSYEEAKMFLEKHNGNILEAIIDLEKKQSTSSKGNEDTSSLGATIKEWFNKGIKTRFVIEKNNETLLNLPIIILIISIFIPPVFFWVIAALFILFIMKYRFKIKKAQGDNVDLNEMFEGSTNKASAAGKDENINATQEEKKEKDIDNDYNEMTIE
jgi:NACalpha-BTF3-like transcription factor